MIRSAPNNQLKQLIVVKHKLDGLFACRRNGEQAGWNNGEEINVFEIFDVKIDSYYPYDDDQTFDVYIRGENTCWMRIDNCLLQKNKEELENFIKNCRNKKLIESRTYVIGANNCYDY